MWKNWVGNKSTGGEERLHAVISSLLLRRTKAELMLTGALQALPERKWELIPVALDEEEQKVYQKVLIFSRTLFGQYLHQRAEKNQDAINIQYTTTPLGNLFEFFLLVLFLCFFLRTTKWRIRKNEKSSLKNE